MGSRAPKAPRPSLPQPGCPTGAFAALSCSGASECKAPGRATGLIVDGVTRTHRDDRKVALRSEAASRLRRRQAAEIADLAAVRRQVDHNWKLIGAAATN